MLFEFQINSAMSMVFWEFYMFFGYYLWEITIKCLAAISLRMIICHRIEIVSKTDVKLHHTQKSTLLTWSVIIGKLKRTRKYFNQQTNFILLCWRQSLQRSLYSTQPGISKWLDTYWGIQSQSTKTYTVLVALCRRQLLLRFAKTTKSI